MSLLKLRIQTFFKYTTLLKELVIRDIKVRYRKSILGLLWTVINPILTMMIITMVFSSIFKNRVANFPLYVLTGQIVFSFNSEATNQSLMSIIGNAQLIKKVYIPKYLFPLSKTVSSLVNLGFSLIAMVVVMLVTGQAVGANLILVVVPILYLFVFSLGLGTLLSAVNVLFRDLGHLYHVFITLWMYLTPIFYSIENIDPSVQNIIKMNPLYQYLTFVRAIVMEGRFPDLATNLTCMGISLLFLVIGLVVFKRLQNKFILYI